MAKTFAVMKSNVGTFVQDTSTTFATIIGVFINDKYRDVARRHYWSALVNNDYTFNTVANTATYDLPLDFEQEIFVANITDGQELERYTENNWWKERYSSYQGSAIQSGTIARYIILEESSKIQLDPKPNAVKTIAFPYKKIITELSGTTDTVLIKDIEYILELGAIGEALAYKKQYAKADYYLQRFEQETIKRVTQEKIKTNQKWQRISEAYRVPSVTRLTGDTSYDTV
jgi:hypothetical protein